MYSISYRPKSFLKVFQSFLKAPTASKVFQLLQCSNAPMHPIRFSPKSFQAKQSENRYLVHHRTNNFLVCHLLFVLKYLSTVQRKISLKYLLWLFQIFGNAFFLLHHFRLLFTTQTEVQKCFAILNSLNEHWQCQFGTIIHQMILLQNIFLALSVTFNFRKLSIHK